MFEILIVAAVALVLFMASRMMAAEDCGITVPTNAVYCGGGDPAYIYMVAEGAITPGDNVEPGSVAASEVKACDASAEEFTGTADKNDNAVLDGNNPMTHDFATGEVIPVITGPCFVRKIAEGGVGNGKIVRPGTTAGTACLVDATSTAKYVIGRCISYDAGDGEPFVMRQW